MKLLQLWICLGIFIPTVWGKRDCGFINNDIFLKKGDKREIKFWVHLNNTVAETWNPKQKYLTSPSVQDTNSPPELVILGRIPLHGPAATPIPSKVAPSSKDVEPENVAVIMAIDEGQTPVQETTPTLTSTESETETSTVPLYVPSKWEISKFDEDVSITEAEPEEFHEIHPDPGAQMQAQSNPVQMALPVTNPKDAMSGILPEVTTETELGGTTVRENLQDEPTTTLNDAEGETTTTPAYDSRSAETSIPTTVDYSEAINNDSEPFMATTLSTVELEREASTTANEVDLEQRDGLQNKELHLSTESTDTITLEDVTIPNSFTELAEPASEDADLEAFLPTTQNPVVDLLLGKRNQLSEKTEIVPLSNTLPSIVDDFLWDENAETSQLAEEQITDQEQSTQQSDNLLNDPTESIEHVTLFVEELLAKQDFVRETTETLLTAQTSVEDNGATETLEDLNSRNAMVPTTPGTPLEAVEDPQVQEFEAVEHPMVPTTMKPETLLPVTERLTESVVDDAAQDVVTEQFLVEQAFDHLSSRNDAPQAMSLNSPMNHDSANPKEPVLQNEPTENVISLLDNRSTFEETTPNSSVLPHTQTFDVSDPENVENSENVDEQDLTQPHLTSPLPLAEFIAQFTDAEFNAGTTDPASLNPTATVPNSNNSTTNTPEDLDAPEVFNPVSQFPDIVQRNKFPFGDFNDFPGLEPTLPTSTPEPLTDANTKEAEPSSTPRPGLNEEESPSILHTNQPPAVTTLEPLTIVQEDSGVKSERIISRPKPSDLLSGIYRIVQSFSQQRLPFQGHFLRRGDNPPAKGQEPNNNSRQIDPFVQLPAPNLALTNESRSIHQEDHEVFEQFVSMAQNSDATSPNGEKGMVGEGNQERIVTGQIHHRASHVPQAAAAESDTVNVDVTGVLPFESGPVLKKGSVVASEPAHDFGFRDGLTDAVRNKDNKFMKFIESQPMPLKMALLRGLPSRKSRQVNSDSTECDWRIRTEPGLYLLVTFHNLSAPYTVDCHGAYIEVERENNGYEARWCGNRVTQGGTRSHVIFARTEVRVSVYDDGGTEKEFPTGFAAEAEVIDLYDAGNYANFRRSEAYSNVRRTKG